MTTFKYEAQSSSGGKMTGVIEAYDRLDAIAKIREQGGVVTKISEAKKKAGGSLLGPKKISEKELSLVCSQFGIILSSGLPLVRTVELVANQTENKDLKLLLTEVAHDVAAGHSLSDSFQDRGTTLSVTFIETVRAGEKSGNLEQSFKRMEVFYDKSAKTKGKVKSALTYPAFVGVVSVVVIVIIMVVAVPMFKETFESQGGELPLPTKLLIAMSEFMTKHFILLAGIVAAIILAYRIFARTDFGREKIAIFMLNMPVLGKVNSMSCASQFANTFVNMFSAGLTVVEAINVTGKVIGNYVVSRAVLEMNGGIEAGRRLGDCMRDIEYFPDLLKEMTAVGEETGSLETTLGITAEYYDNEVDLATTKATALIEPIMIVFLAVFVCFVLLSVYLPMFAMYDNADA